MLFRGREMQHIEEGQRVMNQVLEALMDFCKLESPARMEGKRMVALLAPKPTGTKPAGTAKPAAAKAANANGPAPKAAPAVPAAAPKPTA